MTRPLEIVLLLALPASGKSEVRTYLTSVAPDVSRRDFHIGPTVQLDDYPYVHLMRRISSELRGMGRDGVFFDDDALPMKEPRDWGTLIELVNEDYEDLRRRPELRPASAAEWLLDRFDAARLEVGAAAAFAALPSTARATLADRVEPDARHLLDEKRLEMSKATDLRDKTIVIEFARGGPQEATMPLEPPLGYSYSLARLSDPILERATILYIWVTPEESRRKNEARAKPGQEGDASILHHGVPLAVMLGDYGTDDMGWLIDGSDRPGTVRIEARGRVFHLPVARFDNRVDKTSFVRDERGAWSPRDVGSLHDGLKEALGHLAEAKQSL
jgi:hypothetical protein